jgi:hypothetical protein
VIRLGENLNVVLGLQFLVGGQGEPQLFSLLGRDLLRFCKPRDELLDNLLLKSGHPNSLY